MLPDASIDVPPPTNGRSRELLLEDHEVDHQSVISQQRVIRHNHG